MPSRKVTIDIGINGAFLTRRWEEPDNFMRLTKELGYPYHEFCSDVLDPFFSGDKSFQMATARAVARAAEKYGIIITDIYTGVATHRFHGLSHSHPAVRQRMKEWMVQTMDIALEMGVDRMGGHWDSLSVEVLEDVERYRSAVKNIYAQFRELSRIAQKKGLGALYLEQMYVPSELPWTLAGAEEFLMEVNRGNEGVPVYLTVDTGHQAGQGYGLQGKDADYEEWLRKFGAVCEVVHIQQTVLEASHHWPFTEEYNRKGHVRIEEVITALEYSHRHFREQPFAEFMQPVEKTILIAEIIPASTKTEKVLLQELRETAHFLRKYIPEGGLQLSIG